MDGESLLHMGEAQAGDVKVGDLAGGNIYKFLADLPPGLARFLADGHESNLLLIKALDRQGERTARLEQEFRAYTTGEAVERAVRYEETDRMHRAEQGILMDGLSGIRDQIAETNAALAAHRAQLRRQVRRLIIALALVALIIIGLLIDRAAAALLATLALGAMTALRMR